MSDEQPLAGRRILIAEDNLFAALELEETVRRLGGTPVGPVARLEQALQVGGREALDGALLDVDLRGEHVFPLADLLEERRVPVIFASGTRTASSSLTTSPVTLAWASHTSRGNSRPVCARRWRDASAHMGR